MGNVCCFAGHSQIYDEFQDRLKYEIEQLILNKGVNEFLVGNYGVFDRTAARIVRELKSVYENIKLYLVLPYTTKEINDNRNQYYEDFDRLITAEIPEKTPARYRIIKCNEYMVNESDFLISHVKYSWGGAAKTLEFAKKKKHIEIINISE